MKPRTEKLKSGDAVEADSGLKGRVLEAGPYGDAPFQVVDVYGIYHGGVWEDGVCNCTGTCGVKQWKKLDREEAGS